MNRNIQSFKVLTKDILNKTEKKKKPIKLENSDENKKKPVKLENFQVKKVKLEESPIISDIKPPQRKSSRIKRSRLGSTYKKSSSPKIAWIST